MGMKPYKKAVAVTGTYTDRDGNEKKRYANIGTLFQYDDGGFALKLDTVPIGDGWNGFVSFYELEDKKDSGGGRRGGGGGDDGGSGFSTRGDKTAGRESYDLNDDIPFIRAAGVFDR